MLEVINETRGVYEEFINSLPQHYGIWINLFIFTVLITLYAVFIWKFYRFLAQKDIIKLNLKQYSRSEHPVLKKILASILYFIEYVIILPFLVFFWFAILAIFLILLSKEQTVQNILLISSAVVASVRMTSYYKEDLSRDLAKMFPFTILVVFLLSPNFFSLPQVISKFLQIPLLLQNILYYLVFIIGLEIILRFFEMIFSIGKTEEIEEESEKESK